MFIELDESLETPIYQQLRNQVVMGIASGQLVPGAGLPSVRTLAADLGINMHTVHKAYAQLRDEGYLLSRGSAGTVIARPAGADGVRKRLLDGLLLLASEHKAAGGERAGFEAAASEVLDALYKEAGNDE